MILIHEFHVLELWIAMNLYDPAAPLMQWQERPEKFSPEPAPRWPDSSTGKHCTCNA